MCEESRMPHVLRDMTSMFKNDTPIHFYSLGGYKQRQLLNHEESCMYA